MVAAERGTTLDPSHSAGGRERPPRTRVVTRKRSKPTPPPEAVEHEAVEPEERPAYGPGSPGHEEREAREARRAPAAQMWTPARLYARNVQFRRVMFLDLIARRDCGAENQATVADFEAFEAELRSARVANGWGQYPWSMATDPERFAKHVADLADAFTSGDGMYPSRRRPY